MLYNDQRPAEIVEHAAFDLFWEFGSNANLDEILLRQLSQCDYRNMRYNQFIAQAYVDKFFENASIFSRCPRVYVDVKLIAIIRFLLIGEIKSCDHIVCPCGKIFHL